MAKSSKGRRLIFVSDDILRRLMKAANMQGKAFTTFIEEALEQLMRANDMGHDLKEVVDFFEVLQAQRNSGAVFTPMDVLNYLIGKVYEAEGEQLQAKWYESGKWYGKYLKDKFDEPTMALGSLLRATRWDLDEVEVRLEGDAVKFRCVSAVLTKEGTELLLKFIEGAMHSLGYETVNKDYMKGIILLEFK